MPLTQKTPNPTTTPRVQLVLPIFALFLLAVYGSTVFMPFLLKDETWLLRGYDEAGAYPSLRKGVALDQGRPVFAVLLFATRLLASVTSQLDAIVVMRAVAILCLAIFSYLLFRLFISCRIDRYSAACLALASSTLPSMQVYVSNATWLCIPLVVVTCAVVLVRERWDSCLASRRLLIIAAITQIAAFIATLATYQSVVLVAVPLVLFVFLTKPLSQFWSRETGFAAFTAANAVLALGTYTVVWHIAGTLLHTGGSTWARYGIDGVELAFSDFNFLLAHRLPQALNLWNLSLHRYIYLAVAVLLIGILCRIAVTRARSSTALSSVIADLSIKSLAVVAALAIADIIPLASKQPLYSYTTLTALSLSVFLAAAWSVTYILQIWDTQARKLTRAAFTVFLLVGTVSASYGTFNYFAYPIWSETEFVRRAVRAAVSEGIPINKIEVIGARKPGNYPQLQEFSWGNLDHSFYIYWLIRNVLRQEGLNDDVDIDALSAPFSPPVLMSARREPELAGITVLIDPARQTYAVTKPGDVVKLAREVQEAIIADASEKLLELRNRREDEIRDVLKLSYRGRHTALTLALCKQKIRAARALFKLGADPNFVDSAGRLPVECVEDSEQLDILVAHGLDERRRNGRGLPAIQVLIEAGKRELVFYMLESGFSAEIIGADQRVPLHMAAYYGHADIADALITRGSPVNGCAHGGVTPLDWAAQQEQRELVTLLRRVGGMTGAQAGCPRN